jgi:hypothetical protein
LNTRRNQIERDRAPQRGPKRWRTLIAIATVCASAAAGIAAFSSNIAAIFQNVQKIFVSDVKITLSDAKTTIPTPAPKGSVDYLLPIDFFVVVEGGSASTAPTCSGELSSGSINLPGIGAKNPNISLEIGRQHEKLNVAVSSVSLDTTDLTLANFRLDCGKYGRTPVTPVNVSVATVKPPAATPTEPTRPTESFKVCAGNGGGPSCAAGAQLYLTCAEYRAIGGGAKSTYDALAKRFCQLAPNKVIPVSSLSGGECGWTTFTVICNP